MANLPKKLKQKLQQRLDDDIIRSLSTTRGSVDFVSNDYLGLAKDNETFRAAIDLLEARGEMGNGSTGSRLLSGNNELFEDTENYLAEYYGEEAALIFNSGYDANLGLFSSVPQRGDLILFDEYIHASMRDGIRMGLARSIKFTHNDLNELRDILQRERENITQDAQCYIVTEAVFSMDGVQPELKTLLSLCGEFQCKLILDEAHAIRGIDKTLSDLKGSEYLPQCVFARIVTFGKAIGVQGAAILGSNDLKNYLLNYARSFIYTTALPPMTVASILCIYQKLDSEDIQRRKSKLRSNIALFQGETEKRELGELFIKSNSAIHSCIIPGNNRVKKVAQTLIQKGYDLRPILAPTVPVGKERIRICLHSFNTEDEIKEVLSILAYAIEEKIHS
ncbi:aminotransferase class I/II-fold pyridoxal phosphate-dependent enzyme [Muriicola soli]|uniref:Aminotransferase class I/II-fold pyridoxal phosphate-dependent enzyme n=1 Tax=Muriicola soli TaxID=2507538 RepID=A0A411EC99_9FLAO|nr:aminotransferase class I/II-fold pyridoxal phosphate-dependent enzyme [Muriicola soli]QBA65163.1 aminotransferase class I/II-fold pyridoxal phosphate-dependent enzyme [Muriicola soli]